MQRQIFMLPQTIYGPTMMQRLTSIFVTVVLVGVLTGCRTYGGYGSEEALYRQLQRASEEFSQDLERMKQGRGQLEQRAAATADGERVAGNLSSILELHEALDIRHREVVERLSPSSSHRTLSRAYGAMISDQEMVRGMYRRVQNVLAGRAAADSLRRTDVPYSVLPAFYRRAGADAQITLAQTPRPETTGDTPVGEDDDAPAASETQAIGDTTAIQQ